MTNRLILLPGLLLLSPLALLLSGAFSSILFPLFGLPFTVFSFSLLLVAIGSFFYYLLFKSKILPLPRPLTLGLIFLLQLLIFTHAFTGASAPHHNHDASNHILLVQKIAALNTNQNFKIAGPVWYPLGLHSALAFNCLFTGKTDCVFISWQSIWVFAALIPVGLYFLAKEYFNNHFTALLSALFAVVYYLFPYEVFASGGFSTIAAHLIGVWGLITIRRFIKQPDRYRAALTGLSWAGLFAIHPTTFLTFLLLAVLLNLDLLFQPKILSLIKRQPGPILLTLIAFIILMLPLLVVAQPRLSLRLETIPVEDFSFGELRRVFLYYLWGNHRNLWLLILAGLIIPLSLSGKARFRRYFPLLAGFLGIAALSLALHFFAPLSRFFAAIYPWGQSQRIFYATTVTYPLLAAAGFTQLYRLFESKWNRDRTRILFQLSVATLLIALLIPQARAHRATLAGQNLMYSGVTTPDRAMFSWMEANLTPDKLVLINPSDDAGIWLNRFTGFDTYFTSVGPSSQIIDKMDLVFSLENDPAPVSWQKLIDHHIGYIFTGAKVIHAGTVYLSPETLSRHPNLKLIHQIGDSYLFAVN